MATHLSFVKPIVRADKCWECGHRGWIFRLPFFTWRDWQEGDESVIPALITDFRLLNDYPSPLTEVVAIAYGIHPNQVKLGKVISYSLTEADAKILEG